MKTVHKKRMHLLLTATGVLSLVALLGTAVGCGEPAVGVTPTPTRTPRPIASPIPSPTPTLAPTLIPTPTPVPENINPLTGEEIADPAVLDRVPVAIKISNWPPQYVRPQAGINDADLIFEHYNEGWFATRWTAIYLDTDPSRVGPVRSGRLIDLELPAIYKAVLACWGFSDGVKEIFRNSDLYPDRVVSYSLPETIHPDPFYRDFGRDVPQEHTGYTDPARVRAWAEAHGVSGRQEGLEGMAFSAQPTITGTPALTITIPWRELLAEWRYDASGGYYLRWSDGSPHTDALTGEPLRAANVVMLFVPQWNTDIVEEPHSGALSIQFALWNSNRAILFRDGMRIDGFWQRWERWDLLTVTDEEGNVIPFKPGNSFFEVIPPEGVEVVVEP